MPTLKNGRYEIPERWTTAAQGRWVIGTDTVTGRKVFIKEFINYRYLRDPDGHPELINAQKRTEKFAERMKKINNEVKRIAGSGGDVVVTIDFFRDDLSLYKVTDCIDRVEWSENRAKYTEMLSVEQVDDLMLRIVYAIMSLHQAGLLHCDLKPENVFIVERDGHYIGMVSDFDDSFFMNDVPPGADVVSTAWYMSPELGIHKDDECIEPPYELTPASDLFALGLMYHEYLTGEMPGYNEKFGALYAMMTSEEGADEKYVLNEKIDIAHRMLIDRLIQPEPEDRIKNCAQLAQAIRTIKARRSKEFSVRVMNGAKPAVNKEVSIYATYRVGSDEYAHDVTAKVTTVSTGKEGVVRLSGLPADASYSLCAGKVEKPIEFREEGGAYGCTVQIGSEPVLYTVAVTCDGKPLSGVKVTVGRTTGEGSFGVPTRQTNEAGEAVFEKLPATGCWVECEGIRKNVVWDKNRRFAINLTTHTVRVTRGGKGVQTDLEMKLYDKSGVGRRAAGGRTDAQGRFSFRFIACDYPWKAVCEGEEMDVEWSAKHECELKLRSGVRLTMYANVYGTEPRVPIEGVRMVVARLEGSKLINVAAGNTAEDGSIEMGSFDEGDYYIAAISAPAGCEPKGIRFKQPIRVTLSGEQMVKRILFERDLSASYVPESGVRVKEDIRIPTDVSMKWGRLVRYVDGSVVLVERSGKSRAVQNRQLGLFGLDAYKRD